MKYAIVKNGSAQTQVAEGDIIKVDGTITKPNFEVIFFSDGKNAFFDKSQLSNVKVTTEVINSARARKIRVGRFKSKSRYDKLKGAREEYTNVKITKITFGEEQKEEKVEKTVKTAKTSKVVRVVKKVKTTETIKKPAKEPKKTVVKKTVVKKVVKKVTK